MRPTVLRELRRATAARGFTLVEMLTVVAVGAVLLTFGVTGMRDLVLNQRIKTASFDVYSSLTYARSEAITRNTTVTITPSAGNWAGGWSITDASGNTLRTQNALSNITVTCSTCTAGIVAYNGMGRLNLDSSAAAPQFEITAPGVTGSNMRCIRIDLSGRPVSKSQACS